MKETILSVKDLTISFQTLDGKISAVQGVSFDLKKGETLAIVGESGSGKSVSMKAINRVLPKSYSKYEQGVFVYEGRNLLAISEDEKRQLVGAEMAMIFQDPMTSLNPAYSVGFQIMEALKVHEGGSRQSRRQRTIELLTQVGIPDPESRLSVYPHQLSGGMSQRVMIAMAIACRPKLLIADEPTTALDVTIQAQIIDLLLELQKKENMALLLITHDLALVAEAAKRILVMYAGQVVEEGKAEDIFATPKHPYTQALLRSLPEFAVGKSRLHSLPGVVPGKYDRPQGCLLNTRCPYATDECRTQEPHLHHLGDRRVKCHTPLNAQGEPVHV